MKNSKSFVIYNACKINNLQTIYIQYIYNLQIKHKVKEICIHTNQCGHVGRRARERGRVFEIYISIKITDVAK